MHRYVIAGPRRIGNLFGCFGQEVPEGRFAIVSDGAYSNGGRGPSQAVRGLFDTREAAEARLAGEREQDAHYGQGE